MENNPEACRVHTLVPEYAQKQVDSSELKKSNLPLVLKVFSSS